MKKPLLKPLHPTNVISQAKLKDYARLTTETLLRSLEPGQVGALKARADGTIIDGHHRITILRNRGIDVDNLPREIVPREQASMRGEIYEIMGPWPGQLAILARPRGNDWLVDEVQTWHDAGVHLVLCLLTHEESVELGLAEEGQVVTNQGLDFVSFPIRDYSVPASLDSVLHLTHALGKLLSAGKCVGIHCRQSVGRSGLIAACLLVTAGEEPTEAFEHVKVARGAPVPDTLEQRKWVYEFARSLHTQTIPQ